MEEGRVQKLHTSIKSDQSPETDSESNERANEQNSYKKFTQSIEQCVKTTHVYLLWLF